MELTDIKGDFQECKWNYEPLGLGFILCVVFTSVWELEYSESHFLVYYLDFLFTLSSHR